jgi:hypothetical protein
MFGDNGEASADFPSVASDQALDLLGDILPVDLVGRMPTQGIRLL